MGIFSFFKSKLHEGCDATVKFYEERLEMARKQRASLLKQVDAYQGRILDLVSMRRADRLRFEKLAKSRNRYRRKYVGHHLRAREREKLLDAIETMFRSPSKDTADKAKLALQPFCHHRHMTLGFGLLTATCNICGKSIPTSSIR